MHMSQRQFKIAKQISLFLPKLFPKVFTSDIKKIKPLKINIRQDVMERMKGDPKLSVYFNKHSFRAIRLYVNRIPYYYAILKQKYRYDLDGNIAGEITDKERAHAKESIAKLKARKAEKKAKEKEEKGKKEQLTVSFKSKRKFQIKKDKFISENTSKKLVNSPHTIRSTDSLQMSVNTVNRGQRLTLKKKKTLE